MQTQSCLVPPVSSHVVDSRLGRLNQLPGVQQFFLCHRCLHTYPVPKQKDITYTLTCSMGLILKPTKSKTTHLSFDKFIPIIVWEGAAN